MDGIFLLTEVNRGFNIEIAQKPSLPGTRVGGEGLYFGGE
jgi:hypothetical protein